jgi:hypothetical protein
VTVIGLKWRFCVDGKSSAMECSVWMRGVSAVGYLTGIAIAVNHKGRAAVVSLDDVYRKAARTFRVQENKITQAAY